VRFVAHKKTDNENTNYQKTGREKTTDTEKCPTCVLPHKNGRVGATTDPPTPVFWGKTDPPRAVMLLFVLVPLDYSTICLGRADCKHEHRKINCPDPKGWRDLATAQGRGYPPQGRAKGVYANKL
jgi:hypothetical protein